MRGLHFWGGGDVVHECRVDWTVDKRFDQFVKVRPCVRKFDECVVLGWWA